MRRRLTWPQGKDFAFTAFDDTDLSTVENVGEIYALLRDLGFLTTKSVWPIRGTQASLAEGSSCEERAYLDWVLGIQEDGFEIALHNVTSHTAPRNDTIRGIESFRRIFGHWPYSLANHRGNSEALYWGDSRLTGLNAAVYNSLRRLQRQDDHYEGEDEHGPLFWGDVCREKIKYVRGLTCRDINTLSFCDYMPYHDPMRPYVNLWFVATEGPNFGSFVSAISEASQDRLAAEGGACIIYTHFALGFLDRHRIQPRFAELMTRLSRMNGWFVPVHQLLDHLLEVRGQHTLTNGERNRLERRWLWEKIKPNWGR
jgi:hypothetical protein